MTAAAMLASADAVLVDLDGTLIDSTGPVRRVWEAFASRHGPDGEAVYSFAHGRPSRETIRQLAPHADHDAEAAAVENAEVHDTRGVVALPGAAQLLASDRPLAIVTSCSTALAEARLRAAALPSPRVLISSDGLERGKPDPACFLIAARRLGASPTRCVVIEDAPAGVLAENAMTDRPRTILITGATDGLGRALATCLTADGVQLILHGRDRDRLDRAAAELAQANERQAPATALADLADLGEVHDLAQHVASITGHLDVLVNNAGNMPTKIVLNEIGHSIDTLEEGEAATRRLINASDLATTTGRFVDRTRETRAHASAYEPDVRRRLWQLSLELTGAPDAP